LRHFTRVSATASGGIARIGRWIRREPAAFAGTFDGFAAAARDCGGYDDPDIARVVCEKTRVLISSLGATPKLSRQAVQDLFVLSRLSADGPLGVLELGGACGALFHLSRIFQVDRRLAWTIVESRSMVRAAASLGSFAGLRIQEDLPRAPHPVESLDLVIASGSLQYMPDPLATWRSLLALGADRVYLTRTSVATDLDRPLITRQVTRLATHGPGMMPSGIPDRLTSQPITFVPEQRIRDLIGASGYEVAVEFDEGPAALTHAGHRSFRARPLGLLLERSPASGMPLSDASH
jgi:putative methyltransferase (TIGR04325 family)